MSDTATIDNTPEQSLPTVEQFREVVNAQLVQWSQSTVEGLCTAQTESVVESLASYYSDPARSDSREPDAETFKQVIRDFQERNERPTFADLSDPEVGELITQLAPYFHKPLIQVEEEADSTDALDQHPF